MANRTTKVYIDSVAYAAVGAWVAATVTAAGALIRQTAPAVGAERVFICTVAGTTHATTEPTWTTATFGQLNTDNTVTWQEVTGWPAVNGDATNTYTWAQFKAFAANPALGQIIKRANGASYWICTVAGAIGAAEPAWANDNAGTTRTDNLATWTCLGVVGNFTGWQAPHARLQAACTQTGLQTLVQQQWYVASSHAETQASAMSNTITASAAFTPSIICVTKTNVPPTSANETTGAGVSTTGNSVINNSTTAGCAAYIEGITFRCGDGANAPILSAAVQSIYYKNCALIANGTGAGQAISFNNTASRQAAVLDNTTVEFKAITGGISASGSGLVWRNTPSAVVGTPPTSLFVSSAVLLASIEGVDLSNLGTSLNSGAVNSGGLITLKDCKLHASMGISTPSAYGAAPVNLIRCDSGATNYRTERYHGFGTQTTETTIVRTGGATDGTTPISWQFDTNTSTQPNVPFEALPISIWNDTVGSAITVALDGVWSGGAVPNNDDIWFDAVYPGSTLTPQASFATCGRATVLTAATALSADGSTWASSPGTAFKMSVTFTPQMKGPIELIIKVGRNGTNTFYVDPKPIISGLAISKSEIVGPGVFVNELSTGILPTFSLGA